MAGLAWGLLSGAADIAIGEAPAAGDVAPDPKRATRIVEQENHERGLVRKKQHRFRDVYPLYPELKKQFEESKKDKP